MKDFIVYFYDEGNCPIASYTVNAGSFRGAMKLAQDAFTGARHRLSEVGRVEIHHVKAEAK